MQYSRVKLGDICEINLGKTPPRGVKKFWDVDHTSDMVWVSIADMNNLQDGKIFDSKEYITSQAISECGIPFVEPETLLLSFKLTLGRTAVAGRRLCTNEAIAALPIRDAYKSKIDLLYLKTYFDFFDWDAYASADEKILGKTLNKKKLYVVPIILPPLSVQQEIVARLEKELAKVDEMADAFKRMAELADEEFKAILSETFEHVEGKSVKLGELCNQINVGIVIKPSRYYVDDQTLGIPAFRNLNVKVGYVDTSEFVYLCEQAKKDNPRCILHTGDVVVARSGMPGTSVAIDSNYNNYMAIDILILSPNQTKIYPQYLSWAINSPQAQKIIKTMNNGSAQTHVGVTSISKLMIKLPVLSVQESNINNISTAMERRDNIKHEANHGLLLCSELRKSILQEAFA